MRADRVGDHRAAEHDAHAPVRRLDPRMGLGHLVNAFAQVTGDRQWIHVDVERAKRESPFGGPIVHGYLTLSLLAKFAQECIEVDGIKLAVNYGLNRVRFASPVKVGSRVRAKFVLGAVEDIHGGAQLVWQAVIEIEGGDKPACVAEMVTRWYF